MTLYKDIYDYIIAQEILYRQSITVIDGWDWSMKEHIKMTIFYKNGRLLTGNIDEKPVKNIIKPILNLGYRAEDIDVKDITLYVNDGDLYHMSFLVKKYHDEIFVKENDLDTFFDQAKEEKTDFGGTLIKKLKGARPQVVPLQNIVFCDQTSILSGPIGIKHYYTPDELKEMEAMGWGDTANGATLTIDDVIDFADTYRIPDPQSKQQSQSTGKQIEVYEVHGALPESFLTDTENKAYITQMQIVCFYQTKDGRKQGVTLFKKKEAKIPFKFISRDEIFGRALGCGGVEELSESQVWTTYGMIRMKDSLDAASKIILKTTDSAFASRNKIKNMDNLEVAVLEEGKDLTQIDTVPRNMRLFENAAAEWDNHAQRTGSATDPMLGESPSAGTPFKLQDLLTTQGKGIHEYRKGKFAKFIEEIYQDWIIPHIAAEITKGTKFLTELSQDEMQFVSDCLVRNQAKKYIDEKILSGELIDEQKLEVFKQKVKDEFAQGGSKKFIEILKDELKDAPLKVKVNVAGKQKNLALIADKLTNIFREIFANPQILDDPRAAKIFNKIIEYSGLDPIDFGSINYKPPQQQPMIQQGQQMPQGQMNQLPTNQSTYAIR